MRPLIKTMLRCFLSSKVSGTNFTACPFTSLKNTSSNNHLPSYPLLVNQKPKPKRGTIQQELVRFEELHTKFQRTKSMTKTNEILHLLLQLSNDPNVIQSEHGNEPVMTPAQGSVIESVFSSKLAN